MIPTTNDLSMDTHAICTVADPAQGYHSASPARDEPHLTGSRSRLGRGAIQGMPVLSDAI